MMRLCAAIGDSVLRRVVPHAEAEATLGWEGLCIPCVTGADKYRWYCWKYGLDVDCACEYFCSNCCIP